MGAHVQCPQCEQAYALSDEQALLYAGREFECAQCNARFLVPRAPPKPNTKMTGPLRGELPRGQVTAGAIPSTAGIPTFVSPFGARPYPQPVLQHEPGVGLATASLICALVGMIVPIVPAALAIILGIIALVRIHRGRAEGASLATGGVALGCAGLIIGSAVFYQKVLPIVSAMRQTGIVSIHSECPDHFKAINEAIVKYAAAHQGKLPDRLDDLVAANLLTAEQLVCQLSNDTVAAGTDAAQILEHLRTGHHISYTYTGTGLTTQSPPECVLLYEPLDRHNADGIRVLFADGRVQTIGKIESSKAIARLKSGQNPPWSD